MKVEDMVKVAVEGMQADRFENSARPGESAQNDESRGAWIYFETNEPIGRPYAQNTELVRSIAIKCAPQSGPPYEATTLAFFSVT